MARGAAWATGQALGTPASNGGKGVLRALVSEQSARTSRPDRLRLAQSGAPSLATWAIIGLPAGTSASVSCAVALRDGHPPTQRLARGGVQLRRERESGHITANHELDAVRARPGECLHTHTAVHVRMAREGRPFGVDAPFETGSAHKGKLILSARPGIGGAERGSEISASDLTQPHSPW